MRMPFKRTGTVSCALPSSNSAVCSGDADQPSRKRPCLNASVLIELAKMRHRLLDDASPDAHAAHQPPIAVKLPVLPYRRVAQVHAPNQIQLAASGKYPRLALHAQIRYPRSINP